MSNFVVDLVQREGVCVYGFLILFIQLHFESFPPNLESIHLLNSLRSWFGIVEAHEPYSFGFSIFLGHNSGG